MTVKEISEKQIEAFFLHTPSYFLGQTTVNQAKCPGIEVEYLPTLSVLYWQWKGKEGMIPLTNVQDVIFKK